MPGSALIGRGGVHRQGSGLAPAIEEAIGKETVPSIQAALAQARAAITLQDASAPELDRLAAITIIIDRGDQEALGLLSGLRAAESPAVREAAVEAVEDIESALVYWTALQNVYYGLSLGSVLLLAAIGLAVTFGVMGVINMAHGEMMMLGAYTTYVVQQVIISSAPGLMEWSLLIAIPSAFLVSAAGGVAIERGIIRFLYGRPLETLLATWGLSLIIQQGVRTIFGPTNKAVITPQWMSGSFTLGQLQITYSRLMIIIFALIAFSLLMVFLRRTYSGMQMRAVTQNRRMASAMGVRTNWIDASPSRWVGRCGDRRRGALPDRQCQPQSRPDLHHRQLHGRRVRRRRKPLGHAGCCHDARRRQQIPRALCRRGGRQDLVLVFIILFIQRRPRGLFALRGRAVET